MTFNPRVHECLDGDLSRDDLSVPEQADLNTLERDLLSVAEYVRTAPAVDMRTEILRRLPSAAPRRSALASASAALRRAWTWIWRPRPLTIQLRPATALAAIGLLAVLSFPVLRSDDAAEFRTAAAEARSIYVQFRLDAAEATSVSLAGSFSAWSPAIELRETAPGVWTAMVPLTPGVHDYLFLIDGVEWVPDPTARPVEDDFGGTNSRLFLALPSSTL
jgi:hypothetical protein